MISELPPSSLSLAGHTLESLARESTPSLPSPSLPILQLQQDGLLTEMVSQAQLSQHSQTPSLGHQPACLTNRICMESSTTERAPWHWQRAYGRIEANGIGDSRKTTETETRSWLATVYSCTVCRWSIPGKTWMPTNQIRAIPVRARVSRELRARALQASWGI